MSLLKVHSEHHSASSATSSDTEPLRTAAKPQSQEDTFRKAAGIFKNIFGIATMISDFDLRLSFFGNQIRQSAENLHTMFGGVASSSEEISASTTQIVNTNADLNSAISHIADDVELLNQNTQKSNEILENIKTENTEMVVLSKDMEQNVLDLLSVIEKINQAVKGINKISDQTKLLSLNASIEAARAGTAGKGFAVVANEIRGLSETTKELTSKIDNLLIDMNLASNRSKTSVAKTSSSIERVSSSMETVSGVITANADAIVGMTTKISKVAEMSNEINSSLQESSAALESVNDDLQSLSGAAEELQSVSGSLSEISVSMGKIEHTVNHMAMASGEMVNHKLCGLSNDDFIETVETAIHAHKAWVKHAKNMAKTMTAVPIQTDEHKCGFGHFYYAVQPSSSRLTKLWKDVESLHHTLHQSGDIILNYIQKNDPRHAASVADEVESISNEIIQKFEQMVQITKSMSRSGESVF